MPARPRLKARNVANKTRTRKSLIHTTSLVMPGLEPRLSGSVLDALHTSPLQSDCPQKSSCAGLTRASTGPFSRLHDVDGRDKHGHDDSKGCALSSGTTGFAQPDSRGSRPGMTRLVV